MDGPQESQRYLPISEFINHIHKGDGDLSKIKAFAADLRDTSLGSRLNLFLDGVTTNTGAHGILRGELHAAGASTELYHDDRSRRWDIVRRINDATGYSFNPSVSDSTRQEELFDLIQEFTGVTVDDKTREEMIAKLPGIYSPSVYRVNWLAGDETLIRQDDIFKIDRQLKPGHIINASEHAYTFLITGANPRAISLTELSDYEISSGHSDVSTRVSDKPLSATHFTDRIEPAARNEFIYVGPQSPYLSST